MSSAAIRTKRPHQGRMRTSTYRHVARVDKELLCASGRIQMFMRQHKKEASKLGSASALVHFLVEHNAIPIEVVPSIQTRRKYVDDIISRLISDGVIKTKKHGGFKV